MDETPEHSLKIFKSDGSNKYLLVNTNTQAKEVVVQALQEFNMTSEVYANYALFEVTVTNGCVKQRRLPDDAINLAERIQLSSRYIGHSNWVNHNIGVKQLLKMLTLPVFAMSGCSYTT